MVKNREAKLREILEEEYGIMNNEELGRAIHEMELANIGVFIYTVGKETHESYDRVGSNDHINIVDSDMIDFNEQLREYARAGV